MGTAEELAQDALVAALEQWPRTGVPPNPAGWLMTTAKNRAVDAARRRSTLQRKLEVLGGTWRPRSSRTVETSTTRSTTTSATTCCG